jgi:RNA polymerase sigma factor (sigma-70 family)
MNEIPALQADNDKLLSLIRRGDPKLVEQIYQENRAPFVTWAAQRYQCDDEDAIEIFQQAFTLLYFNIKNDKLTQLTSSLRTYLFSIGKNLFREKLRDKHNRLVQLEDNVANVKEELDNSVLDSYHNSHQREVVRKLLKEIGEPCKTLLELMYINGYSTEAVVEEMGYSDERVVRKRKCLCLKKMREILKEKGDVL